MAVKAEKKPKERQEKWMAEVQGVRSGDKGSKRVVTGGKIEPTSSKEWPMQ